MDLHLTFEQGVPLRRQLELQLRDAIRSGRLRSGMALPASRLLARELGVSRGVVVEAYAQLVAEGYLSARPGAGTRVAYEAWDGVQPDSRPEGEGPRIRYDLRPGQPDFASFPRRRWLAALSCALRTLPDSALTYGNPRGIEELRVAVADYLARARAVIADPERVVISAGLAHGLSNVWAALRDRGATRVAIEDPGWRWQARTVEHAGLIPAPVPVDDRGLVVGELEQLDVDAVAVTPAHQFPTGVVMAPERRSALIQWARRRGALIVEDDYDAEYRYDREPVASLQGLAPDCVAFGGTTSKTLAPALRLAWLVLPRQLVDDVTAQFVATFALPDVRIGGAAAGLHLLAWLPEPADDHEIEAAARRRGVAVHALHRHCTSVAPAPPALLLGYAGLSEQALEAAVSELTAVVPGRRGPVDARHPGDH